MEKLIKLLLISLVVVFSSCEDVPSSQDNSTSDPNTGTEQNGESPADPPAVKKPECQIQGTVLDENLFWAKNENLLIAITADKETEDTELGESHRVLEVYDGSSCERVYRNVLPVNFSPDFPYYLSEITYNNVSQVMAIRGFDKIYIFDLEKRQLSQPLEPSFLNERFAEDAQTGLIQRLELWENYMVGFAAGEGAFIFDLEDPMNARPVLPAAEFTVETGTEFNSLFFLESQGKGYQAVMPVYDPDSVILHVNPLFDQPINIQTTINRSFRNNRFLVLKELLGGDNNRPIGVDMKVMKRVDLPNDMISKKDTEIIAWMKRQN